MSKQFVCVDHTPTLPITIKRSDIVRIIEDDQNPDLSYLEDENRHDDIEDEDERARYIAEDRARLEGYGAGWHMIGVKARATFIIPANGHGVVCTLESPGLWGTESDSGEDYLNGVFAEERATLEAMLSALSIQVED